MLRPRHGWYAAPTVDPAALAAVTAGGRLACQSALRFHGAWVLDDDRVHVATARGRGARRDDLCIHTGRTRATGVDPVVESPLEALERMSRCATRPAFVATADSAIHRGLLSLRQIREALGVSVRTRTLIDALDGRSESGIESLARLALRDYGVEIRPQVEIAGVGRVDIVIGDRLVVELDSWTWHSDRDAFERDRRRDLALAARGFLPTRVTYRRVLFEWSAVEADLRRIVQAGEHRWRPSTRRLAAKTAPKS